MAADSITINRKNETTTLGIKQEHSGVLLLSRIMPRNLDLEDALHRNDRHTRKSRAAH